LQFTNKGWELAEKNLLASTVEDRVYMVTADYCFLCVCMAENEAIVERLSKVLGVPPNELVRKGLEELLESQLRSSYAEIHELKARYDVKNATDLEKKIQNGVVEEHPAWEDLIVLENLEERAKKIRKELAALKHE